jgi:hypothetical protein
MQRAFSLILICLSLVLVNGCSQQLTESKIETINNDILSVHGQITAHAENGDVDAMFEYILDSEETYIQTGDFIQTRQESLEGVRKAFQQFSKIQYAFAERQVTVLTPKTAEMFIKGQATITGHDGSQGTSVFTQKILFVLTDTGWKIQNAHYAPQRN